MSKKNISKCICIMGFILTSGIFFSCGQQGEVLSIETGGSPLETEASVQPESEFQTESKVYVYVCGYVAAPGVYEFEPGHRVIDAIDAAGGFIADAADTYLNLADPLVDGSKLYVPSIEEAIKEPAKESLHTNQESPLLNINTATMEQLMTLPGIGESKAKDIINYRESKGQFGSLEDIMNVPGIKDGVFNKVKDLISVD